MSGQITVGTDTASRTKTVVKSTRAFDPRVIFHNHDTGRSITLTVTQKLLNNLTDNNTVSLNFKYENEDIDDLGQVRYMFKQDILTAIEEVVEEAEKKNEKMRVEETVEETKPTLEEKDEDQNDKVESQEETAVQDTGVSENVEEDIDPVNDREHSEVTEEASTVTDVGDITQDGGDTVAEKEEVTEQPVAKPEAQQPEVDVPKVDTVEKQVEVEEDGTDEDEDIDGDITGLYPVISSVSDNIEGIVHTGLPNAIDYYIEPEFKKYIKYTTDIITNEKKEEEKNQQEESQEETEVPAVQPGEGNEEDEILNSIPYGEDMVGYIGAFTDTRFRDKIVLEIPAMEAGAGNEGDSERELRRTILYNNKLKRVNNYLNIGSIMGPLVPFSSEDYIGTIDYSSDTEIFNPVVKYPSAMTFTFDPTATGMYSSFKVKIPQGGTAKICLNNRNNIPDLNKYQEAWSIELFTKDVYFTDGISVSGIFTTIKFYKDGKQISVTTPVLNVEGIDSNIHLSVNMVSGHIFIYHNVPDISFQPIFHGVYKPNSGMNSLAFGNYEIKNGVMTYRDSNMMLNEIKVYNRSYNYLEILQLEGIDTSDKTPVDNTTNYYGNESTKGNIINPNVTKTVKVSDTNIRTLIPSVYNPAIDSYSTGDGYSYQGMRTIATYLKLKKDVISTPTFNELPNTRVPFTSLIGMEVSSLQVATNVSVPLGTEYFIDDKYLAYINKPCQAKSPITLLGNVLTLSMCLGLKENKPVTFQIPSSEPFIKGIILKLTPYLTKCTVTTRYGKYSQKATNIPYNTSVPGIMPTNYNNVNIVLYVIGSTLIIMVNKMVAAYISNLDFSNYNYNYFCIGKRSDSVTTSTEEVDIVIAKTGIVMYNYFVPDLFLQRPVS